MIVTLHVHALFYIPLTLCPRPPPPAHARRRSIWRFSRHGNNYYLCCSPLASNHFNGDEMLFLPQKHHGCIRGVFMIMAVLSIWKRIGNGNHYFHVFSFLLIILILCIILIYFLNEITIFITGRYNWLIL